MSIAIASSSASAYNEPIKSESLFPDYIRESGFEIVRLIRLYYEYLNSEGQPSQELSRMIDNHDIDAMSDKYLSAIQLQIAKTVPESIAMDKRRLYKIIAQYYNERGSDHSVQTFFRLFFNEFVTVFYPSSRMFNTSGDKSLSSSAYVLQDGHYWQQFSYEIKTVNDPSVWKEAFLKFVHPAGLKLFLAILVLMYADNTWEGPLEYYIDNLETITADQYWENLKVDQIIRKHSPKFQPNLYYDIDYLFKVLIDSTYHYRTMTYDIKGVSDLDLFAVAMILTIQLTLDPENLTSLFRSSYQTWLKFSDALMIGNGISTCTIADASAAYKQMNACRFEVLSTNPQLTDPDYLDSFVSTGDTDIVNWNKSYYSEDDTVLAPPLRYGYLPDLLVNGI